MPTKPHTQKIIATATTIASLFSRLIKFVKNIFHLILLCQCCATAVVSFCSATYTLFVIMFGFTLDREIMECNLIFLYISIGVSITIMFVCVRVCVRNEQIEAIRLQIKLLMNHNIGRRAKDEEGGL